MSENHDVAFGSTILNKNKELAGLQDGFLAISSGEDIGKHKTGSPIFNNKGPRNIVQERAVKINPQGAAVSARLQCPIKVCGQSFSGKDPRRSLYRHLKYYSARIGNNCSEFEKLHQEAQKAWLNGSGKSSYITFWLYTQFNIFTQCLTESKSGVGANQK
jgi:hypothetical protein